MDSEEGNTTVNMARIDLLSKLTTVFDQLAPFEKITSANECTKRQVINNMRSQEKALIHLAQLKERMRDQVGRRGTQQILYLQNNNNNDGEHDISQEILTSVLSKGSFDTIDCSEQMPASASSISHPDLGQVTVPSHLMRDKHLMTLVKMVETILVIIQQDSGKEHQTPEKASKDVQVNLIMPEADDKSVLSAREKQRLSLEERIRARKSEVQDTNEKQKDLELKGLRYEMEMVQQKMMALNEDKQMAEVKVQQQEIHIQEQFDIIQDYSSEIKQLQQENKKMTLKIQELEQQIHNIICSGAIDNIGKPNLLPKEVEADIQEIDKSPTLKNIDNPEAETNLMEVMSNNSTNNKDDESLNEEENRNHFNVFANSFHISDKQRVSMSLPKVTEDVLKLNQDPQAIESQTIIEDEENNSALQTPSQTNEKNEYLMSTQQTMAETAGATPTTGVEKPTDEREKELASNTQIGTPATLAEDKKLKDKKANKGTFEFPDGGWECSKCQNYNFKGRKECNRCKKVRTKQDLTGKPHHLLKTEQTQKDSSAGLKLQRAKMQKNGKFKNLKVDTNLASETERVDRLEKNSALDTVITATTARESPYKKGSAILPQEYKDIKQFKDDKRVAFNPERAGDWVCQRCHNHNFSFRNTCNMCHLSHEASLKMLYLMNISNQGVKSNSNNIPSSGGTGYNSMPKLPKLPSSSGSNNNMMPNPFINQLQTSMRDRVVHVHQYFNTYQVQPQTPYMQQTSGAQGQPSSSISSSQTTPTANAITQGNQSAKKASGFNALKPGQPMPQWRPNQKAGTESAQPATNAREWQLGTK